MQLFGLVNNMLATDRATAERDLSIARYAVIPLSPNSGLIGWVPNTDTLHALIREYRDARKVPLNVEHRLMLGMAPDYDHLTVIQKVEVFEHALDSTSGEAPHAAEAASVRASGWRQRPARRRTQLPALHASPAAQARTCTRCCGSRAATARSGWTSAPTTRARLP
jgi:FKBP12-rapamycin complex-associated protein